MDQRVGGFKCDGWKVRITQVNSLVWGVNVVCVCVCVSPPGSKGFPTFTTFPQAGECGVIVGPHSTKLPQSRDTESDQLGVPARTVEHAVQSDRFVSWSFHVSSPKPIFMQLCSSPHRLYRSTLRPLGNNVQPYGFLRTYAPFRSLTFLPNVAIESN